jgi:hypothetical protein
LFIERPKELFKHCIIKPLEQEGIITRIRYDRCGAELLVRYYTFGTVMHNWFYDFELELKEPKESNKDFFKDY